jgi:hypothetical protein
MKKPLGTLTVCLAGFAFLVAGSLLLAADKPAGSRTGEGPEGVIAGVDQVPFQAMQDPAFERYIDLKLLGSAWANLDAALLTDCGLQLAEGERILFRSHKAITADQVLQFAIKVAAEKKDKATLERLSKALTQLGKEALAENVQAAAKLVAASRDGEGTLTIAVEQTNAQELAWFQECLRRIRAAKLAGDQETLAQMEKELTSSEDVPSAHREALTRFIQKARSALPSEGKVLDPTAKVLNKLADVSRGGLIGVYVYSHPRGLIISHFIPGSSASDLNAQGQLLTGDVIVAYNGQKVWSAQDIINISNSFPDGSNLRLDLETPGGLPFWLWVTPGGGSGPVATAYQMRVGSGRPGAGASSGGRPGVIRPPATGPGRPGSGPGRPGNWPRRLPRYP